MIKAGSFTGSTRAGRLLADLAAARPAPIPFFGELGSVNPVFVTPAAVAARGPEIASAFVTSVAGSAGQLCTKPGLVFVPVDHGLDAPVGASAAEVAEHRLLDPRIAANYRDGRARILATPGVRVITEGTLRFDDDGQGWATPTIVAADLDTVRSSADLREECFGPLSILVEYPADADLSGVVEELFEGNLTSTLQLADGESSDELRALVQTLATRAGRVIVNGWPTGVAVTPAMEHGGPWPATTSGGTSVGTAAISRFLRGVAYQDLPESLLPAPVRAGQPLARPPNPSRRRRIHLLGLPRQRLTPSLGTFPGTCWQTTPRSALIGVVSRHVPGNAHRVGKCTPPLVPKSTGYADCAALDHRRAHPLERPAAARGRSRRR